MSVHPGGALFAGSHTTNVPSRFGNPGADGREYRTHDITYREYYIIMEYEMIRDARKPLALAAPRLSGATLLAPEV